CRGATLPLSCYRLREATRSSKRRQCDEGIDGGLRRKPATGHPERSLQMDREIPRDQPGARWSDIEAAAAEGHYVTRRQQQRQRITREPILCASCDFQCRKNIGHGLNVKDAKQCRG